MARPLGYKARAATLVLAILGLCVYGCNPYWGALGWLGGWGNVNFNINIPLGLNGTVGLLNPDGGVPGPGVETSTATGNNTFWYLVAALL